LYGNCLVGSTVGVPDFSLPVAKFFKTLIIHHNYFNGGEPKAYDGMLVAKSDKHELTSINEPFSSTMDS